MAEKGTLYGIGVGPGDPDLITVKAVKVLQKVDIVFTAASSKNTFSLAVDIAKEHIPDRAEIRQLPFPMTSDRSVTEKAWEDNSLMIVEELRKGKDAAFLTLGDPMTYSTFGYILQHIQDAHPDTSVVTIPGITSYQAAASRMNTPLVEAEESLLITSGAYGGEQLRKIASRAENIVLLKAYKNVKDISEALSETNFIKNSKAIKKCGREGEEIIHDIRNLVDLKPDYWTLILAKQEKKAGC